MKSQDLYLKGELDISGIVHINSQVDEMKQVTSNVCQDLRKLDLPVDRVGEIKGQVLEGRVLDSGPLAIISSKALKKCEAYGESLIEIRSKEDELKVVNLVKGGFKYRFWAGTYYNHQLQKRVFLSDDEPITINSHTLIYDCDGTVMTVEQLEQLHNPLTAGLDMFYYMVGGSDIRMSFLPRGQKSELVPPTLCPMESKQRREYGVRSMRGVRTQYAILCMDSPKLEQAATRALAKSIKGLKTGLVAQCDEATRFLSTVESKNRASLKALMESYGVKIEQQESEPSQFDKDIGDPGIAAEELSQLADDPNEEKVRSKRALGLIKFGLSAIMNGYGLYSAFTDYKRRRELKHSYDRIENSTNQAHVRIDAIEITTEEMVQSVNELKTNVEELNMGLARLKAATQVTTEMVAVLANMFALQTKVTTIIGVASFVQSEFKSVLNQLEELMVGAVEGKVTPRILSPDAFESVRQAVYSSTGHDVVYEREFSEFAMAPVANTLVMEYYVNLPVVDSTSYRLIEVTPLPRFEKDRTETPKVEHRFVLADMRNYYAIDAFGAKSCLQSGIVEVVNVARDIVQDQCGIGAKNEIVDIKCPMHVSYAKPKDFYKDFSPSGLVYSLTGKATVMVECPSPTRQHYRDFIIDGVGILDVPTLCTASIRSFRDPRALVIARGNEKGLVWKREKENLEVQMHRTVVWEAKDFRFAVTKYRQVDETVVQRLNDGLEEAEISIKEMATTQMKARAIIGVLLGILFVLTIGTIITAFVWRVEILEWLMKGVGIDRINRRLMGQTGNTVQTALEKATKASNDVTQTVDDLKSHVYGEVEEKLKELSRKFEERLLEKRDTVQRQKDYGEHTVSHKLAPSEDVAPSRKDLQKDTVRNKKVSEEDTVSNLPNEQYKNCM